MSSKQSSNKAVMQTSYKRRVKKKLHPWVSCYDLYINGDREKKDLCPHCINYLDLNPKSKPQCKMGVHFYWWHGISFSNMDQLEEDSMHCTSGSKAAEEEEQYALHVRISLPNRTVMVYLV
jgi:hypothetical protein